jgi:hypothetical protein
LTIAGSAAGNGYQKRDLIAVGQLLGAARVAAADDRQRRIEASRDPGLETAQVLEEVLHSRTLRQRDAQPAGPGGGCEPRPKSHLDLHRVSQRIAASRRTLSLCLTRVQGHSGSRAPRP